MGWDGIGWRGQQVSVPLLPSKTSSQGTASHALPQGAGGAPELIGHPKLGRGRGLWGGPQPAEHAGDVGQTSLLVLGLGWAGKPQLCLSPRVPEQPGQGSCAKHPDSATDCRACVFKSHSAETSSQPVWGVKRCGRQGHG